MEEEAGFVRSTRTMGNRKKRNVAIIIALAVIDILLVVLVVYFISKPDAVDSLKSSLGGKKEEKEKAEINEYINKKSQSKKIEALKHHINGVETHLTGIIEKNENRKEAFLRALENIEVLEEEYKRAEESEVADNLKNILQKLDFFTIVAVSPKSKGIGNPQIASSLGTNPTKADSDEKIFRRRVEKKPLLGKEEEEDSTVDDTKSLDDEEDVSGQTWVRRFREIIEEVLGSEKVNVKKREFLGMTYNVKKYIEAASSWYSAVNSVYRVRIEQLMEIRKGLDKNGLSEEDGKKKVTFEDKMEEILNKGMETVTSKEICEVGENNYVSLVAQDVKVSSI